MHQNARAEIDRNACRRVDTPLVQSIIASRHGDDVPSWVLENEDNALHDVLDRIQKKAAVGYTGKDLIDRMEQCRCLPLGYSPIDTMLHGGILEGHVMEVFGASGSGKTQLCHMAASMTASRGERVLYIDTNGSFSVKRIMQILGHVLGGSQCHEMLDMVTVVQCLSRVDDVVACIDAYLENTNPGPSMILVDSFGCIMSPLIGGLSYDTGHDMMFSCIMYLKRVAAEHQCAVIVTNHTVRGDTEDTMADFRLKRSALGDTWPGHAHIRLQLVAQDEALCHETHSLQRRAFLHQNTLGIPSHTCVTFTI